MQEDIQVWRDAVDRARRAAADWRAFSVFWFGMCIISFIAFMVEIARHAK